MHITGWHVDAFGTLDDVGLRGLPPGLVVLQGPNASGKSTLLAFIQRTLFGHPHGNRRDVNHYRPLAGERRGGRLFLHADAPVTIERHAGPTAQLRVLADDGRVGDESTIAELTGGCDEQLFNAVFAFDLDDLGDDGLGEVAVRDRLFSAGVQGAGPSARAVRERLAADARALWTPLSRRAAIDEVQDEIADLGAHLAEARRVAAGYPERLEEEQRARQRVEQLDARLERLARLEHAVVRLEEARQRLDELDAERTEVRRQRADLEVDDDLVADVEEILQLDQERLVQRDRLDRLEHLASEWERESDALHDAMEALGEGWDEARLGTVDVSVETRAELRHWQDELEALDRQAREAARDLETAEDALSAARRREDRVRAVADEVAASLLSREELDARRDRMAELRAVLAEAEAARSALSAATRLGQGRGPVPGWAVPVVGLLAVLCAVGSVWAALTGATAVAGGLAVAAVALLVLGVVGHLSRREQQWDGPVAAAHHASQRALDDLADQATALGLPSRPSFADVERAGVELERAERQRGELERRLEAVEEAAAYRADAEGVVAVQRERAVAASDELHQAQAAWADWCEKRDLDVGARPSVVAELMATVDHARQLRQRVTDITDQFAEVDADVAAYARRAGQVLARSGRGEGSAHVDAGLQLPRVAKLAEEARQTRTALAEAQHHDERLQQLAAEQEEVRGRFRKLEQEVDGLRRDGDEMVARHELAAERDEAFRRLVEARRELESVETSQQVAQLDQRRQTLIARRDGLVHQWRVDTLACQLVARTLEGFERDRQPGVLRTAGAHFAEVTEHAYTGVVQEGDQMVVLDAEGRSWSVDTLSRGSVEQLYLCLRLALAEDLAARRRRLPFVMDDVLVNFDPDRAAHVARLLARVARDGQVLYFTCQPHTTQLLRDAGAAAVYDMPGDGGPPQRRPV